MEIVKASIEDYDLIYSIAVPVWEKTYKEILSAEQSAYMLDMMYSKESITEQILIKGHHFLLAVEGGVYLGFASYELNNAYQTTKLHKIYILPEAQGKGVGKTLTTVVENSAKANGNDRLALNVNRYNKAVNFYIKSGFVKAGEENIDIGNGYLMEDFIMIKQL